MLEDIECHSVQDRLLLMLLERVERLEGLVHEQSENLQQLLALTTSRYFSFYINGCIMDGKRTAIDAIIPDIANVIHDAIPIKKLYGKYYFDNTACCVCFETQRPWLLTSMKDHLDKHLRENIKSIVINSWQMHYNPLENYEELVTKTTEGCFIKK